MTAQRLLEIAQHLEQLRTELVEAAQHERLAGPPRLTARQAAVLVPCTTAQGFRAWAQRRGLVGCRRGRLVFYDRRDIEAAKVRGIEHGIEGSRASA